MSRQDKEFPSLGNNLNENMQNQKKKQKQGSNNKKNTSQQANDLAGFYFEGNSNQGKQQNQDFKESRNSNRNNIRYEYVPKQNDQYVPKQVDQNIQKQSYQYVSKEDNTQASKQSFQYVPKQNYQYVPKNADQYVPKQMNQQFPKEAEQLVSKKTDQNVQQTEQLVSRNRNFKNYEESDQQGNQNKDFQNKYSRQKEKQRQDIYNEWNSDAKKYINENQVFYLNEDKYYHETENKYTGKKGDIQEVLMVAEKPSIARSIAEALSNRKSNQVEGYSKYLPVHQFEGVFKGKKTIFKVTSVTGHIYNLDFPEEYKNWNRINPVNLFLSKTQKIEANPQQSIIKHLELEAKDCSYLLLWLDNDREGENICFEVKSICERVMCFEGHQTQQVLRSKFSSLTKPDLVQAFQDITDPPNMNESKAVDARQIIDLKIGSAFTRYQTLFFRKKYPELNQSTISFGPCQTPTLGFCVEREDEIKNFKPKLYYKVKLTFTTDDDTEITTYCDKGDIYDKGQAYKIYQEVILQQFVKVISISSDSIIKKRPEGLNTVELLKVGSSQLNMSPMETMNAAERLYLNGYITYPRTESTAYSDTFQFEKILECLQEDQNYGDFAQELLEQGFNEQIEGIDMGDHPPITPTTYYPRRITGNERKLYDYISKHYLASLSEDFEYENIEITCKVKEFSFVAKGVKIIDKGFTEILEQTSIEETNISSNLNEGDKLYITSSNLDQEYTKPPDYLTESELINLMEKNSIGTDASIATHIQNICTRKYVQINEKNRTLVPTELGTSLIHGYQKIDPELVKPQIRAKIENLVGQIAKGSKQFAEVINESMRIFLAKYLKFIENISEMDFLIGSFCTTFEDALEAAKPFSKCGVCNRFMKLIEVAGKIICEKCDKSLSLPANGKYKLANEKICPYDKYQVILFTSAHTPNVSFEVCPKCYTDSPIMDSNQVTCSICTNDECKLSMNSRLLKQCDKCEIGNIVIEPNVVQKLSASCNECWTQWSIPIEIKDLKVNRKEKCGECESQLISFKHIVQQEKAFQKGDRQDKEGKSQNIIIFSTEDFVDTCLFCDEELSEECSEIEYTGPKRKSNQRIKRKQ